MAHSVLLKTVRLTLEHRWCIQLTSRHCRGKLEPCRWQRSNRPKVACQDRDLNRWSEELKIINSKNTVERWKFKKGLFEIRYKAWNLFLALQDGWESNIIKYLWRHIWTYLLSKLEVQGQLQRWWRTTSRGSEGRTTDWVEWRQGTTLFRGTKKNRYLKVQPQAHM